LVEWFDLNHITPSAAQFNTEKLRWVNQHYIKLAENGRLAALTRPLLEAKGLAVHDDPALTAVCALVKERASTLLELADAAALFYAAPAPSPALLTQHVTDDVLPALRELVARFADIAWHKAAISAAIKETLSAHGLKMPKLAMPVRVLTTGQTQTPAIDATLELIGQARVVERLRAGLATR
jgi:glutamyl-tRNA synthetase (EC 6.1.1.17)